MANLESAIDAKMQQAAPAAARSSTWSSTTTVFAATSCGLLAGMLVLAVKSSGGDTVNTYTGTQQAGDTTYTGANTVSGDSNTLTGAVANTYTGANTMTGDSTYAGGSAGANYGANTYNGDLSITNTGATPSSTKPVAGINTCEGSKPTSGYDNFDCSEAVTLAIEQSGANVTRGYQGSANSSGVVPTTTAYWKAGMCPVNVHWHLGAEHLSVGEYDSHGTGPDAAAHRNLAERKGHQCSKFDASNPKFTKPFAWKHCVGMTVGETYEVHWPHSARGACGTVNQYQTPFYDGVFCNNGRNGVGAFDISTQAQIGVQAQVFTIVNDENYYYPDLMRGMIVDGDFGSDMAIYTGSTTGTSRSNTVCSGYSPITWQVDRKCHMVSASTFDKMCADMKSQRDDMSSDLHAHGSREVVSDNLAADNQVTSADMHTGATLAPATSIHD
jgi:hypothetical protein